MKVNRQLRIKVKGEEETVVQGAHNKCWGEEGVG